MTKHRTKLEKEQDYEKITNLKLQRYSLRQIGKVLNLSHQQVKQDLKVIEERWQEKTNLNLDQEKTKQLETLDIVIKESFQAWENSKQDKIKKSIKDKTGKDNTKEKAVLTENNYGDISYLKTVTDAVKEQNKMLGVHASLKTESKLSGSLNLDQITGMNIL